MPKPPLDGLRFVITGEFGESRVSIVEKLVSLGAVRHKDINPGTNLLIVGTDPGGLKLRKASALGIRLVYRDWLERALKLGNYTLGNSQIKVENA
jgi:NAD-dependent DNA ligase